MNIVMKVPIATALAVAIAGISAPALAGSNSSHISGTGSVAAPEPKQSDAAARTFPARRGQPDMSRVRQVGGTIARTAGASLGTQVKLCVVPSGAVTGVKLLRSSGAPAFDMAVLDSAWTWVYAAYPAPAGTRTCTAVSVVYRAR
jgi:TonB family protein